MNKKDFLILGGLAGLGLIYWKLITNKKNTNKKQSSSFIGSPFGQRVMFTLSNKTKEAQVVPLFNSYSNIQNPNVTITPSISEFNRTLLNEPKKVTMIEIRASGNQKQAEKPLQIQCKDASGEFKGSFLYPMISPMQKALDMTSVQPNNFVISGECYLNYTLDPAQTVVLIFHYELQTPKQGAELLNTNNNLQNTNQEQITQKTKNTNYQNSNTKKNSLNPYLVIAGAVGLGYLVIKK